MFREPSPLTVRVALLPMLPGSLPFVLGRTSCETIVVMPRSLTRGAARAALRTIYTDAERAVVLRAYGHDAWPTGVLPDDDLPVHVPPALDFFRTAEPCEPSPADAAALDDDALDDAFG